MLFDAMPVNSLVKFRLLLFQLMQGDCLSLYFVNLVSFQKLVDNYCSRVTFARSFVLYFPRLLRYMIG